VRHARSTGGPLRLFPRRVTGWAPSRPLEVAGINALHNASPIGKSWKVKLLPKSPGGAPSKVIEDVELYMHLAVRVQKA
jgi:hypothetical protein